ncbi:3-phosphoserine/phosphohydroxythreonine transaminase [Paucilactobacillus suebicus]|uniref:Phosphoserine aminotransferase n=1 Tax=Paucilactobacillus suebicus DSM 5007 = KCTC 3549 TaxID=1423807 RepID=A0A0R1W5D0_9LACO|nr:3-phosphoserine phosphohydroxythreonine aminotransferase [Paucilactobacillus suebicus DSM 5007 = KCTC 3549]
MGYNFSAGPGIMPAAVVEQIKRDMPSYKDSGMSIMEISHRSALYDEMAQQAETDLRDLMQISDDYEVLFLHGGGTLQFTNVPLNLATKNHHVAYLNSGHWAKKALDAANRIDGLTVEDIQPEKTGYLPSIKNPSVGPLDYLYVTTNNTIEGTTYHQIPKINTPLVADMSSNILAEPYDVNQFDLIFAGAQKNIGPAGMAIVIVKKNRLHEQPILSEIMDYHLEAKKHSALNTPPVFCIYAAGLTFKWLKQFGGVDRIYEQNQEQARTLYDSIDNSKLFKNDVPTRERSLTNIVFKTGDDNLDQQFVTQANRQGLISLGGHRLVGGMRASLYNAMPNEGVDALIDFMKRFEIDNGGLH